MFIPKIGKTFLNCTGFELYTYMANLIIFRMG